MPIYHSSDTPADISPESRLLPPRDAVRVGFYFALGILLLALVALVVRRFAEAALDIITPFVISLVLALLLDPLADFLGKRGLSRTVASALIFALFLLLIFGIGWLTIPLLIAQAASLAQNGPTYIDGLQDAAQKFLDTHHKIGPFTLPSKLDPITQDVTSRVSGFVRQGGGQVVTILVGSATFLVDLVLTLILAFYFLVDIDRLRARLFFLAPEKSRKMMAQIGGDVGGVFADYLRGLLIVCGLYGVFTIGLLYGLGVVHHSLWQYALLVGAAAGVLYAVPYIGAISTALITFIVAFAAATGDGASGLVFGAIALGATLLLNQVFDNVVTPRVVGGGVGLNPIASLFALVIGGALFKLPGLLLAVPLAASIQVVLFRLYPRLTEPTPRPFLDAQGVLPDEREGPKVMAGDKSATAKNKRAEKEAS